MNDEVSGVASVALSMFGTVTGETGDCSTGDSSATGAVANGCAIDVDATVADGSAGCAGAAQPAIAMAAASIRRVTFACMRE